MSADDIENLENLLLLKLERSLTSEEETQLKQLLERNPTWDELSFELAAGAVLEAAPGQVAIPEHVRAKLLKLVPADQAITPAPRATVVRFSRRALAGWTAAAAASVAAAVGWWPRLTGQLVPKKPPDPPAPTIAERRALFLLEKDVRVLKLAVAADPLVTQVDGDLAWSSEKQSGYMRFASGVPVNAPTKNQYQLWIFDRGRDDRYPVDGGVFDIAAAGEQIIEITPKVRVHEPTLFAVTLEPPGGVVVSSREHILVVAKPA